MEKLYDRKRKIFISAHPVDRYEYLEAIVSAINSTGSCTALYNPVPSDNGPLLPPETDAIIVIASLKYFVWANSGYSSEYFAAVREGIPVIPFLIEGSQTVIDLVNMRCGKLQYIDATKHVDFALDTLRAHLTAPARKIDNSLPSIFISYRREDRPHLRRLVREIEKMPSYSNINLWYDEVIAPGENYSLAILDHLKKCHLFILLVTPRILVPSNYVLRVEYRDARERRKRILAIEAEHTDKRHLASVYGSLGHILDIKHTAAICSVITEVANLRRCNK